MRRKEPEGGRPKLFEEKVRFKRSINVIHDQVNKRNTSVGKQKQKSFLSFLKNHSTTDSITNENKNTENCAMTNLKKKMESLKVQNKPQAKVAEEKSGPPAVNLEKIVDNTLKTSVRIVSASDLSALPQNAEFESALTFHVFPSKTEKVLFTQTTVTDSEAEKEWVMAFRD